MAVRFLTAVYCVLASFQFYAYADNVLCSQYFPVEEGSTLRVICNASSPILGQAASGRYVIWTNDTKHPLCSLRSYNYGTDYPCKDVFADITLHPTRNSMALTLKNIKHQSSTSEMKLKCLEEIQGVYVTALDLSFEVYVKAASPICRLLPVDANTWKVMITCATERVYPSARCQAQHSSDNEHFSNIITKEIYNSTPLTGQPLYFASQCTVIIEKDLLQVGRNYIKVLLYPTLQRTEQRFTVSSEAYIVEIAADNQASPSAFVSSQTDTVAIVSLSLALAIVTAVAMVLAGLVIRQRRRERMNVIPPNYDRVTAAQPCPPPVYLSPDRQTYVNADPAEEDYEAVKCEADANAHQAEYNNA